MTRRGKQIETHLPCLRCDSSDGAARYVSLGADPFEYFKCFSCGQTYSDKSQENIPKPPTKELILKDKKSLDPNLKPIETYDFIPSAEFRGRGISEETWKFYGFTCTEDDSKLSAPLHDEHGTLVASKVKLDHGSNPYYWTGDKAQARLFGRHLFKNGPRKYITVTEGYEDCGAAYEMLGSKWPVVSIIGGAQAAHTEIHRDDLDFLNEFETIVLDFDDDEHGRKAEAQFAKSFDVGKVKLTRKDLKDANEYLRRAKNYLDQGNRDKYEEAKKAYVDAWWKAKVFRPDGIILSSELIGLVTTDNPKPIALYPFKGLNEMLWGIYDSQLIIITAGSGSGKTGLAKNFILSLFNQSTSERFGNLLLEEGVKDSAFNYISQDIGFNLVDPSIYSSLDREIMVKGEHRLFAGNRFLFWDHFGSSDIDKVCDTVKYFAHNGGCRFVLLDHISIVVSSQENGDERKALDEVMTRLRKLCQDTGVVLFVVSHLKRANGSDAHEEGGVTSLAQLRGSAGIGQLADVVIGMERNGQHTDPTQRNVSTIRILKSRKTGRTGPACKVWWDHDHAQFIEIENEEHLEKIKADLLVESLQGDLVLDNLEITSDSKPIMDRNFK